MALASAVKIDASLGRRADKFHFWLRQQQRPYLDLLTFTFNMMSQTLLGHLLFFQIPLFRLGEQSKK
jgi:hypothetical protein